MRNIVRELLETIGIFIGIVSILTAVWLVGGWGWDTYGKICGAIALAIVGIGIIANILESPEESS